MKKFYVMSVVICIMIIIGCVCVGCAAAPSPQQPSVTEGVTNAPEPTESVVPVENTPNKSTENITYENILTQLTEFDRQQDEIGQQEKAIENQYRNDKITRDEYLVQIAELERQNDELDRQEDELELQLDAMKGTIILPSAPPLLLPSTAPTTSQMPPAGASSDIVLQLAELDRQENELDRQEDELDRQYRYGEIERDSYLEQMKTLDARERELNLQEDDLEIQLRAAQTGKPETNNNVAQGNTFDAQEDELEQKYRGSEITRTDFLTQMAELDRQEDIADNDNDNDDRDYDDNDNDDRDDRDDWDD